MSIEISKANSNLVAERPALTASLFGAGHLLVDLVSISTLIASLRFGAFTPALAAVLVLSYDYIAFASQMFLGYALDRFRRFSGAAAALGCAVTAAGAWMSGLCPVAAVLLVSLGNALFHVGGGAACLRLSRGRAVWAGVFVAPGAVGLFLGKLLGASALFAPWSLTLLLAAGAAASLLANPRDSAGPAGFPQVKGLGLVVCALLLTIVVRSLVGSSLAFPWASGWQQAAILTAAVFAGKALGGALGDRVGWRTVTVAGLLVSAPLLALGAAMPILAVAGILCLNLTMAVTLAGIAYLLPGHEGLAFGLTTTAIVVGLSPTVIPGWKPVLGGPFAVAGFIVLSAAALWFALGRMENNPAQ